MFDIIYWLYQINHLQYDHETISKSPWDSSPIPMVVAERLLSPDRFFRITSMASDGAWVLSSGSWPWGHGRADQKGMG